MAATGFAKGKILNPVLGARDLIDPYPQTEEDLAKLLAQMKFILQGTQGCRIRHVRPLDSLVAKIIPQRPKAAPNKSHTSSIVLYRRTSCIGLPAASIYFHSSPAKIPNRYSPMSSASNHPMLPAQTPSPSHTLSSPGPRLLLNYVAVTSTERALCRAALSSGRH